MDVLLSRFDNTLSVPSAMMVFMTKDRQKEMETLGDAAARLLGRLERSKRPAGEKPAEILQIIRDSPSDEDAGEMAARVSASLTGRVTRRWEGSVRRGANDNRESWQLHPGHPVYVETVEADTRAAAEGDFAGGVGYSVRLDGEALSTRPQYHRGFVQDVFTKRDSLRTARWGEF